MAYYTSEYLPAIMEKVRGLALCAAYTANRKVAVNATLHFIALDM